MSKQLGFLVVNTRTGYMLEAKDHAAKIFDTKPDARRACQILNSQVPYPVTYHDLATSLLKGSAFCFESQETYGRFISALRNDPSNKPFLQFSQDRTFVRWRHIAKADPGASVGANASAPAVPAKSAPVEVTAFNPAILAQQRH